MGDQRLLAQLRGRQYGLQPPRAHHGHAVAQADQLHQLGRDHDDVSFLSAEDDEVKVRLRVEDDGSLTILALAPNTRLADGLLSNVPPEQIRTELCG